MAQLLLLFCEQGQSAQPGSSGDVYRPLQSTDELVLLDQARVAKSLMDSIVLWCQNNESRRRLDSELGEEAGYVGQVRFENQSLALEFVGQLVDDSVHDLTRLTPVLHEVHEYRLACGDGRVELVFALDGLCLDSLREETHRGAILPIAMAYPQSIGRLPA